MDDETLLAMTIEARRIAHTMPIYGAPEKDGDRIYKAVRSSQRACAAAGRYAELIAECRRRGLDSPE